jgi:hypothetical protein
MTDIATGLRIAADHWARAFPIGTAVRAADNGDASCRVRLDGVKTAAA